MRKMQAADSQIALLEQKREAVEEALLAHVADACAGENSEVMGLAKQVLMAGGKRWRPILLRWPGRWLGGHPVRGPNPWRRTIPRA